MVDHDQSGTSGTAGKTKKQKEVRMNEKCNEVIGYLIDINKGHEFNHSWSEGFVIGLNYVGAIDDTELDDLLDWISDHHAPFLLGRKTTMNEVWREEFKTVREKIHPYFPPLPKRKQRVQTKGRSGKCIHYDCMDCFFIALQRKDARLAEEVANIILTLWEA
jgi:hypothetical protein